MPTTNQNSDRVRLLLLPYGRIGGFSYPLNRMHESCILIHMRTTLNINDDLLKQAARLSGITEKTAVVHAGLEALVARESAKRLAAMGGSEPRVRKIRRRRARTHLASR